MGKIFGTRRGELAALRQELSELRSSVGSDTAPAVAPRTSRRTSLRLAGAAAAGSAAAAFVGRGSASATAGVMFFGSTNDAGSDATQLTSSHDTHTLRVRSTSQFDAVRGESTGAGTGVKGVVETPTSVGYGVWGTNEGTAGYAVVATGGQAQMYLSPGILGPSIAASHRRGEIAYDDSSNSLWVCTTSGNPGSWRKLAGATSAGAFHAIATARVYDSRWTGVTSPPWTLGTISSGSNRVITVRNKRDPASPNTILLTDVVPLNASAVAFNLTVVSTSLTGFLAVEPGDAATAGGSTINWSPGPVALANGSVAKLDASRQLKVFCGGAPGNSTHFIIDIVGYYL